MSPSRTGEPDSGELPITVPAGTVIEFSFVVAPGARLRAVIASIASASLSWSSRGTVVGFLPSDTYTLTTMPGVTFWPAEGSVLMIVPSGTVSLAWPSWLGLRF